MKTPFDNVAKIFTKCFGHMPKMADIPIYGKKPFKIFFSRARWLMTLGFGMLHLGCGAYQVCSNDVPMVTLTYLTSRSNLLPNAFNLVIF